MIVFWGVGLWALALLVLARVLWPVARADRRSRARCAAWALLLLAGAFLYARPHEEVLGGEDAGAYLNGAAVLAREGAFRYTDPLLARVAPRARREFLYRGHRHPAPTKDVCVWMRARDDARVGLHFQPAYPLMAALPYRLAPRTTLYVVPFFALASALAAGALAFRLWRRAGAALAVAALHLAQPLLAWHGRHARPEVIASFFLLAGAALLLDGLARPGRRGVPDLLLGSAALCVAPFFHITAAYVPLGAAFVLYALAWRGRPAALLFHATAGAAALLFLAQARDITDTYHLGRSFGYLERFGLSAATLSALGAVVLAGGLAAALLHRRRPRPLPCPPSRFAWCVGLGLAAAYLLAFLSYPPITERVAQAVRVYRYAATSDIRAFVTLVSPAVALLALAGLAVMLVRPVEGRGRRLGVVLVLVPATLFFGRLHDLFMTRYLLVTLVPLASLALGGLLLAWPADTPRGRRGRAAALLVLVVLMARGHGRLYTTVERRGLLRCVTRLAAPVQAADGMLLCEYPRMAAPLDHFMGLDVLAVDAERRNDYTKALDAWAALMERTPGRQAFFLTPYESFAPEGFALDPVAEHVFTDTVAVPGANLLPAGVRRVPVRWRLYRMVRRTAAAPFPARPGRTMDDGNMGLRGFVPGARHRQVRVDVLPLGPGGIHRWDLAGEPPAEAVVLLGLAETDGAPLLLRDGAGRTLETETHDLGGGWRAVRPLRPGPAPPDRLEAEALAPFLLHGAVLFRHGDPRGMFLPAGDASRVHALSTRTADAAGAVYMPAFEPAARFLLVLVHPGVRSAGAEGSVRVRPAESGATSRVPLRPGAWQWTGLRLPSPAHPAGGRWYRLDADPPGLLVARTAFLPSAPDETPYEPPSEPPR